MHRATVFIFLLLLLSETKSARNLITDQSDAERQQSKQNKLRVCSFHVLLLLSQRVRAERSFDGPMQRARLSWGDGSASNSPPQSYCGVAPVVVNVPTVVAVGALFPTLMLPLVTLPVLVSKLRVTFTSIVLADKGPLLTS